MLPYIETITDPPIQPSRSKLMSRVRQANTKPKLVVQSLLHALGFRFRLHLRGLAGTHDIVLPRYRTAIFVHGCFWHRYEGCSNTTTPKTRQAFWQAKFDSNVARDCRSLDLFETLDWRRAVVWECETKDAGSLRERLSTLLASPFPAGDCHARVANDAGGDWT